MIDEIRIAWQGNNRVNPLPIDHIDDEGCTARCGNRRRTRSAHVKHALPKRRGHAVEKT
jgi:hypothetical protein